MHNNNVMVDFIAYFFMCIKINDMWNLFHWVWFYNWRYSRKIIWVIVLQCSIHFPFEGCVKLHIYFNATNLNLHGKLLHVLRMYFYIGHCCSCSITFSVSTTPENAMFSYQNQNNFLRLSSNLGGSKSLFTYTPLLVPEYTRSRVCLK